MNFITLTGYYPTEHEVCLDPHAIIAFTPNVINPNSQGSVVHLAGAITSFQVRETPNEISELLNLVEEPRV